MDYSALAQLLNQDAQKQAQQNPWLTAANNFSQVNSFDPYGSSSKNMGQTVLKGLLTGLTGAYGNRQVEQDTNARNESLRGFMSAAPDVQETMLQTDQYLKPYSGVLGAIQADEQQQLASQLAKEDRTALGDISKAMITEQVKNMPKEQLSGIKLERLPDGSYKLKVDGETPIAKSMKDSDNSIPGKTKRLFKEFRSEGFPDTQAATAAGQVLEADRKKMGKTFAAIEAGREKGAQLDSMAQTAEQGLSTAGKTGGLSSDWGASILGFLGVPGQAEKAAGTTLLNSVKPTALSASKVPGMGAMSDFESKAFFAAAPGSDKLPEQNMALISKIKQAAQLENEHADFLETYINEQGTDRGAQSAWTQYKKSNPLIVQDPRTKEWVVNPNRRPWADMFGGGAMEQASQGGASGGEIVTLPNGQKVRVVD